MARETRDLNSQLFPLSLHLTSQPNELNSMASLVSNCLPGLRNFYCSSSFSFSLNSHFHLDDFDKRARKRESSSWPPVEAKHFLLTRYALSAAFAGLPCGVAASIVIAAGEVTR